MDFEDIKSTLFTIFVLGLLGFGGYWAFSTMESGSSHIDSQKVKELEEENRRLKEEASLLKSEISDFSSDVKDEPVVNEVKVEEKITDNVINPPKEIQSLKYQTLINELQKLITDNIYMKKGSQGSRVGTVQKFLNIYNNTSNRVDNDYGASTEIAIKNFQKTEGLGVDGQAGPGTFKKMIDWLKKQG